MTRFIDNQGHNTLDAALDEALGGNTPTGPAQLDIASGFFTPAGLIRLGPRLDGIDKVRLMFGAEPPRALSIMRPNPGETKAQFEKRLLAEGLEETDALLHSARDRFPFTPEAIEALRHLIGLIKTGKVEARRYDQRFLHAKAYLYGTEADGGMIVGSSNLTGGGLIQNLEASLQNEDADARSKARTWFTELWDEAAPFDLAAYLEALIAEYTPYEIYIRMLLEVYGDEVVELAEEDKNLPLTTFQKHGVARALRLLRERGGVIVADEVGLGKTFIAGEIMSLYSSRRQRILVLAPAALRDDSWKKFLSKFDYDITAEVVSYEQLANDKQLGGDAEHLQRPLDEYQLIVIDEAHNYRNPASPTRAGTLRRLLTGRKRDVVLLTATPVNNSIWDLYHAIRTFVRQDAGLADSGIVSLRQTFRNANASEPTDLNPDLLFPVIDATCVKRTRQFVKRHYADDTIVVNGEEQTIVFPKANAITVRYPVEGALPALFDQVEACLDPTSPDRILFARYNTDIFRIEPLEDANMQAAIGLIRSGLLKRFESSVSAFRRTLEKMIGEHLTFLEALDEGHVISTEFLREWNASDDEEDFGTFLANSRTEDTENFDVTKLKQNVGSDLSKLQALHDEASKVDPASDAKLEILIAELERIAKEAKQDGVTADDQRRNRKVLIFSYFSDTVGYIRNYLAACSEAGVLEAYVGRIASVSGAGSESDVGSVNAVAGFAPVSSGAIDQDDLYDILVTTDVLAEGVNLQECRHVINFDMPWNPMRLVQRHGRVDRIGSIHPNVFLRTVFPADRLDQLLNLESRIMDKIALAARSIGVMAPVEGADDGGQVFSETRTEIEKLLIEDPSLYERGGTESAAQSAEEYRQTLRKELATREVYYRNIPRRVGSGMLRGSERGVVFCARVGDDVLFRFVPTDSDWTLKGEEIKRELASCLRRVECEKDEPRFVDDVLVTSAIYDLWSVAQSDIERDWNFQTDPKNIQPRVDRMNREIAAFMRDKGSSSVPADEYSNALAILESPWDQREKNALRDFYRVVKDETDPVKRLVTYLLESGVEAFRQPELKSPITDEDVELICWMAVA